MEEGHIQNHTKTQYSSLIAGAALESLIAQGLLRYEARAGSLLLQAEEASQPEGVGFMRLIAG